MYTVHSASRAPALAVPADCPVWAAAEPLVIGWFHPASSAHRPHTTVRLLSHDDAVWLWFKVADRHIRATRTAYQSNVCKDSCVEFFFAPRATGGYFNLECSASGAWLFHYNEPDAGSRPVSWELGRQVTVRSSFGGPVEPELPGPHTWHLTVRLPLVVVEAHVGDLGALPGQRWTANFFKCGTETSHPHWAAWQPLGEHCRFHQPDRFAPLDFAAPSRSAVDNPPSAAHGTTPLATAPAPGATP